jgi:CHAD domain-containing protein
LAQALAKDPRLHRRRSALRALAERLAALNWPQVSPDAIERGLVRSERRVRRAQNDMEARATVKNLHRWRRRVRRLRMQLELIRRIRNKGQSLTFTRQHHSAIRALSARSDAIGAIQDLRTLRRVISHEIDVEVGRQLKKTLQALEAPHQDVVRSPLASEGSGKGASRIHSD